MIYRVAVARAAIVAAMLGVPLSIPSPAQGATAVHEVVVTYHDGWRLYAFCTQCDVRHPGVLFVHGGAWHRGWLYGSELDFARRLATTTGWTVAAFDYSVASPRWSNEPRAVHAAMLKLAALRSVDPQRLAIWGESAGGQLALLEAYTHPRADGYRVRGVVSISGPTDMISAFRTGLQRHLHAIRDFEGSRPSAAPQRYRDTSPTTFVRGGCPATFQGGSRGDYEVPPSQLRELDDTLARAGVRHQMILVQGHGHSSVVESVRTSNGHTVQQRAVTFLQRSMA